MASERRYHVGRMYTILLNGIEVRCESADEVVRLTIAAKNGSFPAEYRDPMRLKLRPVGRPPKKNTLPRHVIRGHEGTDRTLQFLMAVETAGTAGIAAGALVSLFKLPHKRAIGGLLVGVNNRLKHLGFDVKDVYRKRGEVGNRKWSFGAKLSEAIKTVEAQGGMK